MAFATRLIVLPPDEAMALRQMTKVRFEAPMFRIIDIYAVIPHDRGVLNPKLSVSRTRDRFSMMNRQGN